MRSWRNWLPALVLAGLASGVAADVKPQALPASGAVSGWSLQGVARSFTPRDLWEYIDGEADLFVGYGFRGLETGQYARDTNAKRGITLDVYDMGTPLNAYGIYANERGDGGTSISVGAAGYVAGDLIAFWKGGYYVKIAMMDSRDARAARALAQATAARLRGVTRLPAEFNRLPRQGRVAGSERYVRKDALGHKDLTNVISANYRIGKSVASLHRAELPDIGAAKRAWDKLRTFERSAGKGLANVSDVGQAAFAVRDATYGQMIVVRQGPLVVIATSDKAGVADLAGLVRRALS